MVRKQPLRHNCDQLEGQQTRSVMKDCIAVFLLLKHGQCILFGFSSLLPAAHPVSQLHLHRMTTLTICTESPTPSNQSIHADYQSSLINMLNITVRSSSGQDLALDIPVLHARHIRHTSTPTAPKQKRLVSRPQTTGCETPPFTEFDKSVCQPRGPERTGQTFILSCKAHEAQPRPYFGGPMRYLKYCQPNEICVTQYVPILEDPSTFQSVANCVSEVNFRLIQESKMGGLTPAYYASHVLTLPQKNALGHTGLVATLVGRNDFAMAVVAERILLQAVGAASVVEPLNGLSLYVFFRRLGWWLGSRLMSVQ